MRVRTISGRGVVRALQLANNRAAMERKARWDTLAGVPWSPDWFKLKWKLWRLRESPCGPEPEVRA